MRRMAGKVLFHELWAQGFSKNTFCAEKNSIYSIKIPDIQDMQTYNQFEE